ncbi:hypothetical protein ACJ73_08866, partial [Blastomyces percursus]
MPPGVKSAVVQTATKHLESLWQKKPFQDIVRGNGDFAVDMIQKQVGGDSTYINLRLVQCRRPRPWHGMLTETLQPTVWPIRSRAGV